MSMVAINWAPSAGDLRKFGATMIVGFGLIGLCLQFGAGHEGAAIGCYLFGALTGALGLTGTAAAKPIYWAWMGLATVMGTVMGHVLLAAIYFGLVTPMGLVMRLAGHDPLQLRRRPAESYWVDVRRPTEQNNRERQF